MRPLPFALLAALLLVAGCSDPGPPPAADPLSGQPPAAANAEFSLEGCAGVSAAVLLPHDVPMPEGFEDVQVLGVAGSIVTIHALACDVRVGDSLRRGIPLAVSFTNLRSAPEPGPDGVDHYLFDWV